MAGLLILPNFITAASCIAARRQYADAMNRGVTPRGTTVQDTDFRLVNKPATETLSKAIAERLRAHFNLCPLSLDYAAYTRLLVGGGHELHADAVKLDGTPNHTPKRLASAMLYLTEWGRDFTGGLIHFPGLDQVIPPRAGMLVGFLTGLDYRHEVPQVTSGVRDALALWFQKNCGCGCK